MGYDCIDLFKENLVLRVDESQIDFLVVWKKVNNGLKPPVCSTNLAQHTISLRISDYFKLSCGKYSLIEQALNNLI